MQNETSICSIAGCFNTMCNLDRATSFYSVPKDLTRATKWSNALKGRISDTPLSQALICAQHFTANNFEPKSNELMEAAVPTVFPKPLKVRTEGQSQKKLKMSNISRASKERTELYLERNNVHKLPVERVNLDNSNAIISNENAFSLEGSSHMIKYETVDEEESTEDSLNEDMACDEIDNVAFHSYNAKGTIIDDAVERDFLVQQAEHLTTLKQRLLKQHEEMLNQEKELNEALESTDKEIKKRQKELERLPEEEEKLLKKCFSATQIRHLVGQSKTKWSLDDLAMAYTISSLTSRDFYSYLKKELKFPLPSVSNITKTYKLIDRRRKRSDKNTQQVVDFETDE